jgi:hypothetical protein
MWRTCLWSSPQLQDISSKVRVKLSVSTQRIYRTGLCATGPDELERSLRHWPSLRGAGFGFEFRPHAIDGERKAAAKTLPRRFQSSLRPPEVHILAPSSSRADAAALLLYAAHALIDASIPAGALVGWDPYRAIPTGRQEFLVWERINHYTTRPHSLRLQISGVADIVGLAARLSRRSKWTHAAFSTWQASISLVWIPSTFIPRREIRIITGPRFSCIESGKPKVSLLRFKCWRHLI